MDVLQRVLQDAVDSACAEGADIVHDMDRRERWSPQQARIWVRLQGDGCGSVSLERLRHWSEGYSSFSRKVNVLKPDGSKRLRRMIEEQISLVTRLQQRDTQSVKLRGTRYEPSPESFVCHPVGVTLAKHVGYVVEDMASAWLEKAGDEWRALQDTHDAISNARVGDVNQRRVRIRGERILFREIDAPSLSYSDLGSEGPVLTVACDLPETAMAAMGKLSLAQIVDHPAFDGLEPVAVRRIERTTIRNHPAIALHLKRQDRPLATTERQS